ncbi:MAG: hypothetical protein DRR00_31330, partial [Candidatus Parabeggiatoa sp. nov. 3]
ISYAYNDNTGKLKTLTAPDGSTLSYTYDGSLPLSETWSNGDITSTLSLSYDNHFQVTTLSLNGNAVNYEYDADGQISKAGDLGLTRNEQNGLFTGTQLGNLTTQRTHNTFSEMASETATLDGNTLYRTEYQRDQLGRITQKVETLEGVATTFDYRYDVAGRLIEVKQDGVIVEAYSYDDNGNRLSADTTHSSVKGQYDNQDRLTQYGDNTYDYSENGELRRKNNNGQITQYHYDVLGNLQTIQLPSGKQIEYVIDGRNRRVGKKVNGQLVQAFLYQGSLNPVAELDANGNVVSRFIYSSKANIPDYMLKDGKTYRVLSDHLGSPRLVVDISDGTVAQRMDYDAFGNVTFDSNPGFQPFGFAGGIYDLDTQLTRFGARDYDAQTGRWTAKDPILFAGGDTNLYGYVLGDPINGIDPQGLQDAILEPIEAIANVGAYDAYTAYQDSKTADKAARELMKNDPNLGWLDWADGEPSAYRHCVWSCLMTQHIGNEQAEDVGDIHEFWGDNSPQSSQLDQCNNQSGRDIGEKNPNGDCIQLCSNNRSSLKW